MYDEELNELGIEISEWLNLYFEILLVWLEFL